jgi:hypothetical protein
LSWMKSCKASESSYQRGCRCEDCTKAHRLYSRKAAKDRRMTQSQDKAPKKQHVRRDTPIAYDDAFTREQIIKARK